LEHPYRSAKEKENGEKKGCSERRGEHSSHHYGYLHLEEHFQGLDQEVRVGGKNQELAVSKALRERGEENEERIPTGFAPSHGESQERRKGENLSGGGKKSSFSSQPQEANEHRVLEGVEEKAYQESRFYPRENLKEHFF